MQTINTHKASDDDIDLNNAFHFAGRGAWFKGFGTGKWYGHNVCTAAISNDRKTVVIAWQDGYVRGAQPWVEKEVEKWIAEWAR